MLKIVFGDMPEAIYNTSVYFDNTYEACVKGCRNAPFSFCAASGIDISEGGDKL